MFFEKHSKKLSHFIYQSSKYDYVICRVHPEVTFSKVDKQISYIEKEITGNIQSSLYLSFSENNYPIDLVNLMVDVFAWQIDFFRINPGELSITLKVLFPNLLTIRWAVFSPMPLNISEER